MLTQCWKCAFINNKLSLLSPGAVYPAVLVRVQAAGVGSQGPTGGGA